MFVTEGDEWEVGMQMFSGYSTPVLSNCFLYCHSMLDGDSNPRAFRPSLLKVWSPDQQRQHHLELVRNVSISGHTPDLPSQNLYFNTIPGDLDAI